ncbi:MAG: hypothetical protein HUU38_11670 [Anaerolineales bacterium]|nr:hypothetical protein [Anaerolineales bacterium]
MANRNSLILGLQVLFGLVVIPTVAARAQGQSGVPLILPNQSADLTCTPTPINTLTPSPSPDPTDDPTTTATPTLRLIPLPTPTFTATSTTASSASPYEIYLPLTFAIPPTVIHVFTKIKTDHLT